MFHNRILIGAFVAEKQTCPSLLTIIADDQLNAQNEVCWSGEVKMGQGTSIYTKNPNRGVSN